MKLQHKVWKLKQSLVRSTDVEGANNTVSHQDRKIKQLQNENRELKENVQQLQSESKYKDAKKGSGQAGDSDRRRYAIRPELLETFCEIPRFHGTCYQVAN